MPDTFKLDGMDFHIRKLEIMLMFRALISLLLIVIMLPWGAYAARSSTQLNNVSQQAVGTHTIASVAMRLDVEVQNAFKKKCRTATLPGSPCSPDRALPNTISIVLLRTRKKGRPAIVAWYIEGRTNAPPRDPPRLF